MPNIPFVRYFKGQRNVVMVNRPQNITSKADAIFKANLWLVIEELTSGEALLSITDRNYVYQVKICDERSMLLNIVDDLIGGFDLATAIKRTK